MLYNIEMKRPRIKKITKMASSNLKSDAPTSKYSSPERLVWVQEEVTGKWVLVGLSADGEVQDPADYEDVQAPLPDQPSGRVWMRDETTGKWINLLVEASKEELKKADAALKRHGASASARKSSSTPSEKASEETLKQDNSTMTMQHNSNKPLAAKPSIFQKYAQRLELIAAGKGDFIEDIPEEGGNCSQQDYDDNAPRNSLNSQVQVDEHGMKYHILRPSDTFQFICLKYKVSASALQEANNLTGKSLENVPNNKLIIPTNERDARISQAVSKMEEDKLRRSVNRDAPPTTTGGDALPSSCRSGARSATAERDLRIAKALKKIADDKLSLARSDDKLLNDTQTIRTAAMSMSTDNSSTVTPLEAKLSKGRPKLTPLEAKLGRQAEEVRYHVVEPDDSLRWICLKYKVSANDLRRANNFSGSNLKLAPKKLIIPKSTRPKKASQRSRNPMRLSTEKSINEDDVSLFSGSFQSSINTNDWDASTFDDVVDHVSVDVQHLYDTLETGSTNAPVPMVHLQGAKQLYGQMAHGSDSDTDGSDSEKEDEATADGKTSIKGTRYHDVRPTDTVEYLCLKYRVSASALRRANIGLTGRNLQTGPKRLIIPPSNFRRASPFDDKSCDNSSYFANDDDTNTIACSEGQTSTIASQLDSLYLNDEKNDEPVYHDVTPDDTLAGICLQYGISAYELRRANGFRGMNLAKAPERLVIPKAERKRTDFKNMTEDGKIQALIAHMPKSRHEKKLTNEEARKYLVTNGWNFSQALRNAKVDADWSSERQSAKDSRR